MSYIGYDFASSWMGPQGLLTLSRIADLAEADLASAGCCQPWWRLWMIAVYMLAQAGALAARCRHDLAGCIEFQFDPGTLALQPEE